MLFSCSSCATKYKLPDEKIAGKVLKIRCKKCSSVIVVRDPKLVSQKAIAAAKAVVPSAPRPPAPAEQPVWFVGIDGQQQGPMTLSRLAALADAKKVTLRSYVWRAGMADWVRAGDLPELVNRLESNAKAAEEAATRAAAAQAEADRAAAARSRAAAEEQARAAAEEQARAAAEEQARAAAEEQARAAAEEQARAAAEEQARAAAEEQARAAAEEQARAAAEEQARAAAEEQARAAAEEQARAAAEKQARAQAELATQAVVDPTEAERLAAESKRVRAEADNARKRDETRAASAQAEKAEADKELAALDAPSPKGAVPDPDEIGAATLVERSIPSGLLADLADINAAMDAAEAAEDAAQNAPIVPPLADAPSPSEALPLPELPDLPPVPAAVASPAIPATSGPEPAIPSVAPHGEASLVFGDGVDPEAAAALESTDFDDFFDAVPEADEQDIFSDFDAAPEKVSKDDKAYFKQQMKEAAAALDDLDFGSDPMPDKDSLRQEFSLLIRLDKQKKKSYVWVAIAAAAIVAVVAVGIVVISQQNEETEERARNTKSDGDEIVLADFSAKYESLIQEVATEEPELAEELKAELAQSKIETAEDFEAVKKRVAARRVAAKKKRAKKKAAALTYVAPKTAAGTTKKKLAPLTDAEKIAMLSNDKGTGPTLNTAAMKKKQAALQKEVEGQKLKAATDGQAKLKKAFRQKVRQFARCKDDNEEKVKVTFKLSHNGRVETCNVAGTKNTQKSTCVMGIMKRAIFPDGAAGTYKQTITL